MAGVAVRFPNASLLREWAARGYERVAETMSAWSRAAGAGRALLLERAGITPGQRVLDLCSGPDWLAIEGSARGGSRRPRWRSWSGRRDSNPRPSAWEASAQAGPGVALCAAACAACWRAGWPAGGLSGIDQKR